MINRIGFTFISGNRDKNRHYVATVINSDTSSSKRSTASTISTNEMEFILDKLKSNDKRNSTKANYLSVWRNFNAFIIKLDRRPDSWEQRICLYGAYLIDTGVQSGTLRSYYSAIKAILRDDNYIVDDDKVLLTSLAKACRLINDKVKTRLPIRKRLMEMLLFEIQRIYENKQPYLEILFKTIFIIGYYGLFRIGELTSGSHPVKAADVHIGQNKNKLLFVLYTSKTHGWESRPQKVKISAEIDNNNGFFCPFRLAREYLAIRGSYSDPEEPFFVYRDKSPVTPTQVTKVLKQILKNLNLDHTYYGFHGMRHGRCTDLIFYGKSIQEVKSAGRWSSSTVYKYIRP